MATSTPLCVLVVLVMMVTFANSAPGMLGPNANAQPQLGLQTTTRLPAATVPLANSATTGNAHTTTDIPVSVSSMTEKTAGDTTKPTVSELVSKSTAATTENKSETTGKEVEKVIVPKAGLNTETARSSSARAEPLMMPVEFTLKGFAILIGVAVIGVMGAVLQ